jgi:hypothetical protein
MDASVARATLEMAGWVSVMTSHGEVEVRIVSPEHLHARAASPFYTPLWLFRALWSVLSHLRRWLRRDRRRFVVVVPVGAGNRDGEIRAEVPSRAEAIDQAVAIALQLALETGVERSAGWRPPK